MEFVSVKLWIGQSIGPIRPLIGQDIDLVSITSRLLLDYFCWIFAQVSRRVIVRLNTGPLGCVSTASTQK